MALKNFSIPQKVIAVVSLMGIVAGMIAVVGWHETSKLRDAMEIVGRREEAAREAMDLRVDIIAISRMTYQVAQQPNKASDFSTEADRRTKEMLERWNGPSAKLQNAIKTALMSRDVYVLNRWNMLFIAPPLTVSEDELRFGVAAVDAALDVADRYAATGELPS